MFFFSIIKCHSYISPIHLIYAIKRIYKYIFHVIDVHGTLVYIEATKERWCMKRWLPSSFENCLNFDRYVYNLSVMTQIFCTHNNRQGCLLCIEPIFSLSQVIVFIIFTIFKENTHTRQRSKIEKDKRDKILGFFIDTSSIYAQGNSLIRTKTIFLYTEIHNWKC